MKCDLDQQGPPAQLNTKLTDKIPVQKLDSDGVLSVWTIGGFVPETFSTYPVYLILLIRSRENLVTHVARRPQLHIYRKCSSTFLTLLSKFINFESAASPSRSGWLHHLTILTESFKLQMPWVYIQLKPDFFRRPPPPWSDG
jgi:hypothetical protein